jgi:dephospho-CoA kinase
MREPMPETRERPGPPVIGLTGPYCAGKNYVAGFLAARGLPVLDLDRLGHRVLEEEKDALEARFGPGVLDREGGVNRRLLGERVFGNPGELAALEGIVHPAVNRRTGEWIAAQGGRPCVINAALLHRSSAFAGLTGIILVRAPLLTRLLRARKRDKLPWGELFRRFHSQKNFLAQYLREKADIYIVPNRGCAGFCSRFFRRNLENRINRILSQMGIDSPARYVIEDY